MRNFNATFVRASFVTFIALTGCSSFSATIVSADAGVASGGAAAGGESSTGGATGSEPSTGGVNSSGGAKAVGGVSAGSSGGSASTGGTQVVGTSLGGNNSIGGASALGGIASSGGTNASLLGGTGAINVVTGGVGITTGGVGAVSTNIAGTSSGTGGSALAAGGSAPSAGGTAAVTGGTAATGGSAASTGGTIACSKDADCVNPDPINCSHTCVNPGTAGTCKPSVLTSPTRCATDDCAERAISGFWSDGKPYIAYGFTETDGTASIRMQQLRLDGTREGEAAVYKLPAGQGEPTALSSNVKTGRVGLLWQSELVTETGQAPIIERVVDFALADSADKPTEVTNYGNNSPLSSRRLWLQVNASEIWVALGVLQPNAPPVWQATTGATVGSFVAVTPTLRSGEFGFAVLGDTLMLTGADCSTADSSCDPSFSLQRYSASSLAAIGPIVTLSSNYNSRWPAMGVVRGSAALLWTESQSPGQVYRALLKEDATFAMPMSSAQSAILPKAVIQSADGGALLIGTVVMPGSTPMYQLVGQRLDASLDPIGNPLPLAESASEDADGFETRLSNDGKHVLLTYLQDGARYRMLATDFCE